VARCSAGLSESHGALDMASMRCAKHAYLRQVAVDLRVGQVASAVDALQQNGAIHAYTRHDDAKAYLVDRYIDAVARMVIERGEARPREAILLCDTHDDLTEMNAMVQQRLIASGAVGEGVTHTTSYGSATFCDGDLLSMGESKRGDAQVGKWRNGDRALVLGHGDDGVLSVRRLHDGVMDTWSTREHGAIQLGYAMTSRRPQGKTVDDVFVLPACGRQGTYVDITRARDTLTIAYGEDEISDFGALMLQAQRDGDTVLVRDAVDTVADRLRKRSMAKELALMEVEIARHQDRLRTMGIAEVGDDHRPAVGKPLTLDQHDTAAKIRLESLRRPPNIRPKAPGFDLGGEMSL
jgi:hypothetical protein